MAEYIERDALMVKLGKVFEPVNDVETALFLNQTLRTINFFPAADVVEVGHGMCDICESNLAIKQDCDNGYYIEVDREQKEMSVWLGDECLAVFSIEYCPNCGAKMAAEKTK